MVFSSLIFLCVFFPIVLILYHLIPSLRGKNILLLIASILFYACGEPVYVVLLIISALINYIGARIVAKNKSKAPLAIIVILNIGILCVFKYTGFIVTTINTAFHSQIPVPQIVLPVGISFFTFQALSYVIDVYRGRCQVQNNFAKVLLYISFFPQLIAGPIVKYIDISHEINERTVTWEDTSQGLQHFIIGLSKKVLIANTMGLVTANIFSAEHAQVNTLTAWVGAVAYMMQIYYDFSGYSDMAIGLGRMFGFHFKENFLYPYGATSIKDFWHKWHISLSSWFKDYLYIPLGGNRKGAGRTALNKIIVFFMTGLWHGANWTFIVWGLFHGFFLLLEDAVPKLKKLPKVLAHIYTFIVVCVGFVIFNSESMRQALFMIKQMFTGMNFQAEAMSFTVSQFTPWFIVILIVAIIGMAPIRPLMDRVKGIVRSDSPSKWKSVFFIICLLLLFWCILRLANGGYNPFIYFRF